MGDYIDTFGYLLDETTGKFVRCAVCGALVKSYPEIEKRYCTDWLGHKWQS